VNAPREVLANARRGIGRLPVAASAIAGLLVLVVAAVLLSPVAQQLSDAPSLLVTAKSWLPANPSLAVLAFLTVGALVTAIGLPRQGISLIGGWAFGVAVGTCAAILASIIGAALAFSIARRIGRPQIAQRFPVVLHRLDTLAGGNAFARTLALRLLPVGSNLATNVAAGVSRIDARAFFAASAVGYAPQSLAFALAGHGVAGGGSTALLAAVGVLLLSIAYGRYART